MRPTPEMHASEMHACEMHVYEMHDYETYASKMHGYKMHGYEMHAYEIHAYEMHGCEMHASAMFNECERVLSGVKKLLTPGRNTLVYNIIEVIEVQLLDKAYLNLVDASPSATLPQRSRRGTQPAYFMKQAPCTTNAAQ